MSEDHEVNAKKAGIYFLPWISDYLWVSFMSHSKFQVDNTKKTLALYTKDVL